MSRLACVLFVLVAACTKDDSRGGTPAPGAPDTPRTERGAPGADCKDVGETLTSIDLGNYAELEERAPVVAKYEAACAKAQVSKQEAECLDKATDRYSAAQCVPRMFPELAPSTTTGDCKQVADKIRAITAPQVQGLDNPTMKAWFETTMTITQQSCEQDAWPDAVKRCILSAPTGKAGSGTPDCNAQMPMQLTMKMQERLKVAMQKQFK